MKGEFKLSEGDYRKRESRGAAHKLIVPRSDCVCDGDVEIFSSGCPGMGPEALLKHGQC